MGSRHTRRHGPGVRNRLVPGIHAKKRDAIVNAHCARECRDPGLHLNQLPLGFAVPAKELHVSRMTLNDGAVVADTDGKAALRGEMFDALSYAIIMADEALAGLGYEDAIVLNTTVMCGDLITHFNGEHVYNHHDLKYKVITSGRQRKRHAPRPSPKSPTGREACTILVERIARAEGAARYRPLE